MFTINLASKKSPTSPKTQVDLLYYLNIMQVYVCDHLLSLQSLLQLQSERLCGSHHARSHHVCTWVVHACHAREAPCLAHLIHYGVEAARRLALHRVATITRLHTHRGGTWGPGVALVIHGFLVHA